MGIIVYHVYLLRIQVPPDAIEVSALSGAKDSEVERVGASLYLTIAHTPDVLPRLRMCLIVLKRVREIDRFYTTGIDDTLPHVDGERKKKESKE